MEPRLIVGISGASGAPLALAFLRGLRAAGVGAELIVSRGGALTLRQECGLEPQDLAVYADADVYKRQSVLCLADEYISKL